MRTFLLPAALLLAAAARAQSNTIMIAGQAAQNEATIASFEQAMKAVDAQLAQLAETRPQLGVAFQGDAKIGVRVTRVRKGASALEAGVACGDVVAKVAGTDAKSTDWKGVYALVVERPSPVPLSLRRGSAAFDVALERRALPLAAAAPGGAFFERAKALSGEIPVARQRLKTVLLEQGELDALYQSWGARHNALVEDVFAAGFACSEPLGR